jgi:hypothetical protein
MRILTIEREVERWDPNFLAEDDNGGVDKDRVHRACTVSGKVGMCSMCKENQEVKQASIHQQNHIYNEKDIQ